ncbi:Carrier domain-containing protein OS=Lysinibacillus sphaericus OX=1421 GN=LS41612_16120 PE=3 SV=1 [Lysinibacillus sphaericus]
MKVMNLPALATQYKDYTAWQNEQYQTDKLKQQETYWLDKFDGEIPILELPTDYQRPPVQTFKGTVFHLI